MERWWAGAGAPWRMEHVGTSEVLKEGARGAEGRAWNTDCRALQRGASSPEAGGTWAGPLREEGVLGAAGQGVGQRR